MTKEWGRRMEDKGQEPPQVVLARIDENIKFLKSGAEAVRLQLYEHEKKDDSKFKEQENKLEIILRSIWMVSGGAAVVMFIINWFHK